MRDIFKQFRPYDYLLIGLALLLSFTPAIATTFFVEQAPKPEESQFVAIVKINGEIVDKLPLQEGEKQEITYHPNPGQYNIVEVDGTSIRVREDNSPDQIAVNTGWISKPGETLICLPHQLVIEIQQRNGSKEKDTDSSEEELILPL